MKPNRFFALALAGALLWSCAGCGGPAAPGSSADLSPADSFSAPEPAPDVSSSAPAPDASAPVPDASAPAPSAPASAPEDQAAAPDVQTPVPDQQAPAAGGKKTTGRSDAPAPAASRPATAAQEQVSVSNEQATPPAETPGGPTEAPPDPPAPGGTEDFSDPNAPTSVTSAEITSFRLTASLLSVALPAGSRLLLPRYELSAARQADGSVSCSCSRVGDERSFTAGAAFLEKLQAAAEKYELAKYNGIDRTTHGLPEDFGVTLAVDYASGERIRAADNSVFFLPPEAVEALADVFFSAPEAAGYAAVSQELARQLMAENTGWLLVDVRSRDEYDGGHIPGAVCVPLEDIQAGLPGALPDRDRPLLIYCRTGRRSKLASEALAAAGYTCVYEFGGIVDWTGGITPPLDYGEPCDDSCSGLDAPPLEDD